MGTMMLKEDRERSDGSAYIYWSIGSASGEAWTDADAWEAMARALHADVLGVIANAEARGRAAERTEIAADLRVWAEQGGDPWMAHVADEVAAGRRPETDNNDGADGREGVT